MANTPYPYSPGTEDGERLRTLPNGDNGEYGARNLTLAGNGILDDAKMDAQNILDIPPMPESWKKNLELAWRYQSLVQVIRTKPEWWGEWKHKIELKDDGIDFKPWHFVLKLHDFPKERAFFDLIDDYWLSDIERTIPYIGDLWKLHDFFNSAWEDFKQNLYDFLGFRIWFYWSSHLSAAQTAICYNFTTGEREHVCAGELYYVRAISRYK